MFREFLVWISETLFNLLGGEPLANTIWIIPWVFGGTLLFALPLLYPLYTRNPRHFKFAPFVFIIIFFPGMVILISPGAIQGQLMTECRDNTASLQIFVDDKLSETDEITIKQCRYKDNYYGEFGEWELKGVNR